ncbi:MAG TPA: DUF4430 domain-containing protein, partial [Solirubrobacterales bacterium]|nr:DUF4430 domain-containing protein [Solirubrobacterales bacterium]
MSTGRGTAVAIALLGAALAAAGCGVGPGADVGEVSLSVTRDYGAQRVRPPATDGATESDTVMRLLERNAQISTRYGGGFVRSIEGLAETVSGGRSHDWFFYVNGVESPVGAADFPLHGGEAIWWDYRDWQAASRVPAVVGSWPQPFTGGYEGERHPVEIQCEGGGAACGQVRHRLAGVGVEVAAGSDDAIRVLVGPWGQLRDDPAAAQLESGPEVSGVFAVFVREGAGFRLKGLDERGEAVRDFGPAAGLVAATRRYEAPPVWLVTGTSAVGVRAAANLVDAADL